MQNANHLSVGSAQNSRAARRRQKRAAERRAQEQAAAKVIDPSASVNSTRSLELRKIEQQLAIRRLRLYEVPSDGDCLYLSVAHQMRLRNISLNCVSDSDSRIAENVPEHGNADVRLLRRLTAQHLRNNKEEFLPFLLHPDTGESMTPEAYNAYCDAVEQSSAWGGQVEVRAISNVFHLPIEVLQAEGQPVIVGDEFNGPPITIVYHRHVYALGEHYNSCVPVS